jgi:hypothetical protein
MTNIQTTSCCFLPSGLASSTQPTDINGISSITDGINHALLTQNNKIPFYGFFNKKLITSYIKYRLTSKGKLNIKKHQNAQTLTNICN